MNGFINWLKEYPLYAVGFVGVIIVFLIVLRFTAKAYSRYYERYRKEEAERKLKQTQENMDRVLDIFTELENRVGPLEKEAEKAKKFAELYEKKKVTLVIREI